MAPKKPTIVLNIEQFINDIQERPAIWNRNFHCNKAFLEQMWDELSSSHSLAKTVLKAKWKGLRDNFRVEYKRIPRDDSGGFLISPETFESKWIHYYALLFLTDHMRHRMPKSEQEQLAFQQQQGDDCEKTIVEPDLTNGLIRCIQDSDEDYDEDEAEAETEGGEDETMPYQCSPPAAHQTVRSTSAGQEAGQVSVGEDAIRLLMAKGLPPPACHMQVHHMADEVDGADIEVQDLSLKSTNTNSPDPSVSPAVSSTAPEARSTTLNSTSEVSSMPVRPCVRLNHLNHSEMHSKKRPVSPPPLYNKAHHPPPSSMNFHRDRSRDRDELMSISDAMSLTSSPELLNYAKPHCCANSIMPHLRRRRARHSEDSNYNGSSIADSLSVSDDDDYYYLLSLHPYIKQLTPAQNLRTRTKIQKIIFKELYKEELEDGK